MGFTAILWSLSTFLKILLLLKIIGSTIFITIPMISVTLVYLNYEMYKIAKSKVNSIPSTNLKNNGRKKIWPTFLVVLCSMVFTLPRAVLSAYTNNVLRTSKFEDRLLFHLQLWSSTIMIMNSSFNTIVFFWKNSVLRREGLKIVRKLHFCKR